MLDVAPSGVLRRLMPVDGIAWTAAPRHRCTLAEARTTTPERAICAHDSRAGRHLDARSDVGGTRRSADHGAACGARGESAADRSCREHVDPGHGCEGCP